MTEKGRKKATADDGRDRPKKAQKPVFDRTIPPPAGLLAKEPPPQPKLKHQAYFEFVENTNRKKQLESQITVDREPPPGFTFVPNGKPELTSLCKEISREKDAMIFIVSTARDNTNELSMHTSRIGHHIREVIVEEAQATLGYRHDLEHSASDGAPEPIPRTQQEINVQANAALRELFPRIPNTDRQEIVDHAFRKGAKFHGEPVVGLSKDISLSRRVQLAVLAHIRHRHTRYDSLLRETTWQHARKTVEAVCLDMIVKWRGDEENGRDTLDSILREVVVISDSEGDGESDDEGDSDDEVMVVSPPPITPRQRDDNGAIHAHVFSVRMEGPHRAKNATTAAAKPPPRKTPTTPGRAKRTARALRQERRAAKKTTRGFKRYQAAWEEAVDRSRHGQEAGDAQPPAGLPMQIPTEYARHASAHPVYDEPAQPPHQLNHTRSNSHVVYVGPARRPEVTNMGPVPADVQHPTHTPNLPPDGQISPRPVQPRVGEERAPMMTRSLTNPSLPVGTRGSHYQDLLVPSIEGPPPATMAPQFVRPLASRKHPRDESPGPSAAYLPPQSYPSAYPAEVVQDGHVKRRRVISDRDGMAVPSPDLYPRNPPFHHGHTQREPEIRRPVSYATLEPVQAMQDIGPRQVYYERRPQPVETRQHQQPVFPRQPNGAVSQGSEIIELRRGVQEPPSYRDYHAEHIQGPPREYRRAPAPAPQPQRHDQGSLAPYYSDYGYPNGYQETRQAQRPSAQPIFVRTLEPRTGEVQPRGGPRDSRYAAPGDAIPSQRWEPLPAQYSGRGHSLEPFYEVNRQPAVAPTAHRVPTTQPHLQEPIAMEPRHEQPHPHVLPHPGRDRPLPPRDVFVYD